MTRVFYTPVDQEIELEFIRWTSRSLVVRQSPQMKRPGRKWRIGRRQVVRWLRVGVLRIEGDRPDWARIG